MEKNSLKQHFRSGSRPTQDHFYALIDACYNEHYSVYISGYEMKPEMGDHCPVKSITREAGKTHLVPEFNRINAPTSRTYHYAVPICNLGSKFKMSKIYLDLALPSSGNYEAKDKTKMVKISQSVTLRSIVFYARSEPILTISDPKINLGTLNEMEVDLPIENGSSIDVDITVDYHIKSNIAVSDEFNISEKLPDKLNHVFGGLGCEFKLSGL